MYFFFLRNFVVNLLTSFDTCQENCVRTQFLFKILCAVIIKQ